MLYKTWRMNFLKTYSLGVLVLLVFASCGSLPESETLPLKREFRGVWVATVVNIDWPGSGTDTVKKQQEDFIKILDFYRKLNFNAVILQVRTAGDALYPSQRVPWSRFLTGKEGEAPKPYYDPLEWMIEETHKRGFEFHAWLNPYRATFDLNTALLSPEHDYFTHPEWMIKYGKKYYYNPGLPEVREHLLAVMEEVIQNYDIDAVHFDDYFYPYKIKGEVFEDSEAFKRYGKAQQTPEDWRRENINTLIRRIHELIVTQKPWVQFGVSPFGVWRNASEDPAGSDTQGGQTTYDDLYADPLLWMKNGWIDYVVPQLYWSMEHPRVAHRKLVAWWAARTKNTALYIGNGAYKINSDSDRAWHDNNELPKQLSLARNTPNVQGNVFFSARSLRDDNKKEVLQLLSENFYKYKALPPLIRPEGMPPPVPELLRIEKQGEKITCIFKANGTRQIRALALYGYKNKRKLSVEDAGQLIDVFYVKNTGGDIEISISRQELKQENRYAVTCVDRYGRESRPLFFKIPR